MPAFTSTNQPTHNRSLASKGLRPCGCPSGELHDCEEFPLSPAVRAYLTAFDAYLTGGREAVSEDGTIITGPAEILLRITGVELLGTLHPCHPDYVPTA